MRTENRHLQKLVLCALFCALAYITRFIFHFHLVFLTFEIKDAIIALGSIFLGPVYSVVMALVVALLEFLTLSDTGFYGLIMNFVASFAFTFPISCILHSKASSFRKCIATVCGIGALILSMIPLNLYITPLYLGGTMQDVVELIPTLLLPFNLIKGIVNSCIVLLLYTPVARALSHVHVSVLLDTKPTSKWIWIPLVLLLISLLLFFFAFHGTISFVNA